MCFDRCANLRVFIFFGILRQGRPGDEYMFPLFLPEAQILFDFLLYLHCQEVRYGCFRVYLNGGTPKTPQNDHF